MITLLIWKRANQSSIHFGFHYWLNGSKEIIRIVKNGSRTLVFCVQIVCARIGRYDLSARIRQYGGNIRYVPVFIMADKSSALYRALPVAAGADRCHIIRIPDDIQYVHHRYIEFTGIGVAVDLLIMSFHMLGYDIKTYFTKQRIAQLKDPGEAEQ